MRGHHALRLPAVETHEIDSRLSATTTILESLFGDEMEFTLVSNVAGSVPRNYTRFSDVARDVVDARIYMGIHFRFADTTALRQGRHVANWMFGHYLRPIDAQ